MNRVQLTTCAFALMIVPVVAVPADESSSSSTLNEINTDLLIVGGTESGWAAAIQAARLGVESITVVHDGHWLGGQFTEQALACVDENKGVGRVGWGVDWHPMKRSFHRSGLFAELMDRIEAFNEQQYGQAMPGRPYHGPSTFRPCEAEAIFRDMLQPYIDSGQVRLILNHVPVAALTERSGARPRLSGLLFAPLNADEADLKVTARLTIDASDWGDAVQLSGAEFECGPDPQSRYGEVSAPVDLSSNPPNEMNPITWAMIVVESDEETPVERPAQFDDRNYPRATFLSLNEFRGLTWDHPKPGLGAIPHWPDGGKASPRQLSVHTVRRVVDGATSNLGKTIILLNYMNGQDYPLERLPQHVVDALEATEPGASAKNIVLMTREQRDIIFEDAKRHAVGVLYHLQNFVHDRAPDKTHSFRRFQLSDEFGTADRLPPKPYIRESLRLKAMYMMREQDGRNRDGVTKDQARERFAHVMYPDGLFAWQFHYDFHRTGRTYLVQEGAAGPWIDFHKPNRHTRFLSDRSVFPLRSLIPRQIDGLIGAQKNLGYSSIVSAAIRLHDQCIAVGQAAGAIATVALKSGEPPAAIPYSRDHLAAVRDALCGESPDAVPLLIWPFRDIHPGQDSFVAVNRLAAMDALPLESEEVDFHPQEPATNEWMQQVIRKSQQSRDIPGNMPVPTGRMTRGEFCRAWWASVATLPHRPFPRLSANDADGDGIRDEDDALLFTPNQPIQFRVTLPRRTPTTDGIVPEEQAGTLSTFNFCAPAAARSEGLTEDHGQPFDERRGYGWQRDLSSSHRDRGGRDGKARQTFVFTRSQDTWECAVPSGRYEVTVCVGDSAHAQQHQRVIVESQTLLEDVSTRSGEFAESSVEVNVTDGRLTVVIGSGRTGSNTCLNWLRICRVDNN